MLRAWDTPTICNGLKVITPERQAIGFTVELVVAADHTLKPIVGLARTGMAHRGATNCAGVGRSPFTSPPP